ncbi:MAG: FmdB family zinc ribbon protein [Chloroflexota bacterium]
MPTYDYRCLNYGEVSEFVISSDSSKSELSCPACGGHRLERLISAPNLLKGGPIHSGTTCCGRTERCETPPCSTGGGCRRH